MTRIDEYGCPDFRSDFELTWDELDPEERDETCRARGWLRPRGER